VRTAASAVLAARWLNGGARSAPDIAFIGAGVIARNILDMFVADGWDFGHVGVNDPDPASAAAFVQHASSRGAAPACGALAPEQALRAGIVVFATNAGTPYVRTPFQPGQVVLHISLRDIAPELVPGCCNIVDDVDHCLKANTSLHLAEQQLGHRGFVAGTLAQLMRGEIALDRSRPLVFSPFGLGILDLALGKYVYDVARTRNMVSTVPDFFHQTARWQA
jgi:ornithine cyclodeaminase/alanine dehydrogenase-like protein (mu-crystallin family)